ncbi:hypothetical protein ILUMI_11176 [Ignelater luminosus]|uniref:Protein sleepless n=1 Tax=Ignelater luminosus TaxID=2038154 RepID=A0A8K0CWF8_IGNLU|nr:hypothetical protein ILUMI_11176 [Ignelater luminosus]
MASYHCYLLLVAFSLFVFIQIVTPLRCYVCTTKEIGSNCTDPFDTTMNTLDTCDLPTAVCLKQILPALGKLPESLHRSCVDETYCKAYEKQSKHCSVCKQDGCNSSFSILPSFSTIVLSFGVYYYIYNNLTR